MTMAKGVLKRSERRPSRPRCLPLATGRALMLAMVMRPGGASPPRVASPLPRAHAGNGDATLQTALPGAHSGPRDPAGGGEAPPGFEPIPHDLLRRAGAAKFWWQRERGAGHILRIDADETGLNDFGIDAHDLQRL